MQSLKRRQEMFCQHYLLDPNGARAARAAGYADSTARRQATRLLARDDVHHRLSEMRRELARRYCLDADVLMAKLEAVYQRALEAGQCYAASRAVELQARLAGLMHRPDESEA